MPNIEVPQEDGAVSFETATKSRAYAVVKHMIEVAAEDVEDVLRTIGGKLHPTSESPVVVVSKADVTAEKAADKQ
jgi:hypothetical protein